LLKIVDLLIGIRVSEEDEIEGLDLSQHGEDAYSSDLDLIPVEATTRVARAAHAGTATVIIQGS
jgi:ammonium transporter family